jgi:DNA-directed RNA polymerase subunit M/transcription elongation factor TFIIS
MDYSKIKNKLNFTIPIKLYQDNNYCKLRRAILILIAEIMQKNARFKTLDREEQDNIIIEIELSCYNETIKKSDDKLIYKSWDNDKFIYLYQLSCNKITKNLDQNSEVKSDFLINQILDKKININSIGSLTSDELCPDKSINIKNTLKLRNEQKLNYKTSTLYKCKNCGKKEVKIQEYQGRSLDEGSNLSLTCNFCNFNWVIG